jgi:Icc-related predicted phosphoesterase
MGYSKSKEELQKHWKTIDRDIDVLITHSPSFNILDLAWVKTDHPGICEHCGKEHSSFKHWGDPYLAKEILKIKPKVHICGHVHDEPGFVVKDSILRINAAM